MKPSNSQDIYLLGKRLQLRQPEGGFRPGLDSVMLAAACPAQKGESVLDLGCGVGSAGLCVLTRVPGASLTGIDIQADHIELAKENAALNNMESHATFLNHDITNLSSSRKRGSSDHEEKDPRFREESIVLFDHVICNPPYMNEGQHTPSPDDARAVANGHVEDTTLEDWIKAAFNAVKSGGSLTMIHRADMTDKIIQALGKSFGNTEIIPLWPKAGTPAKRVIIRTIKHRKSPASLHPGIVLHENDGEYTKEAEDILRGATALL